MSKKSIVLLSGGIDSTTTLYWAKHKGYSCFALIFDYHQKHKKEIKAAKKIASLSDTPFKIVKINLPQEGSSLLDENLEIPRKESRGIPSTYVPARNIIFLSMATSFAEVLNCKFIFFGANIIDYSGYPDCRPSFIKAFQRAINIGTKRGLKEKFVIKAPLLMMRKSEIIKLGSKLGVPFKYTWSCYRGEKKPCLICPSCRIRLKGFEEAGIKDPLLD